MNDVTFTFVCLILTICSEEPRWFSGLDGILIFFLMLVGLLVGIIINVDISITCYQSYKKWKAKKKVEPKKKDLDNIESIDECLDNSRKLVDIQAVDIESELEPSHTYQNIQNQNMQKTIEQPDYSNEQNVTPEENGINNSV